MIKISGIFILSLIARNSKEIDSLTLTLNDTLMPLLMTSIQVVEKNNYNLTVDFKISYDNMVIEKGNYQIKLTGKEGKYDRISLILQSGSGESTIFALPAETKANTETDIQINFALFQPNMKRTKSNNIH